MSKNTTTDMPPLVSKSPMAKIEAQEDAKINPTKKLSYEEMEAKLKATEAKYTATAAALAESQEPVTSIDDLLLDPDVIGPRTKFDPVTENLVTFTARVNEAKLNGEDFIETSKKVFLYYTKGKPTPYLMYEGIKVFVAGTREAALNEEKMSLEDYVRLQQQRKKDAKAIAEANDKARESRAKEF